MWLILNCARWRRFWMSGVAPPPLYQTRSTRPSHTWQASSTTALPWWTCALEARRNTLSSNVLVFLGTPFSSPTTGIRMSNLMNTPTNASTLPVNAGALVNTKSPMRTSNPGLQLWLLFLLGLLLPGCGQDQEVLPFRNLDRPTDMAFVCGTFEGEPGQRTVKAQPMEVCHPPGGILSPGPTLAAASCGLTGIFLRKESAGSWGPSRF